MKFFATGDSAVNSNTLAVSTDGINWTGLGDSIFSVSGEAIGYSVKQQRVVAGGSGKKSFSFSSNFRFVVTSFLRNCEYYGIHKRNRNVHRSRNHLFRLPNCSF